MTEYKIKGGGKKNGRPKGGSGLRWASTLSITAWVVVVDVTDVPLSNYLPS
jgi:hypothetical protein